MKYIIEFRGSGRSFVTENREAADALEKVATGKGFSLDDYDELSPEAKKVFDEISKDCGFWLPQLPVRQ